MEKLEKVELVREKCNVSYEEARTALEACEWDVLDAVVMLEREADVELEVTEVIPTPVDPEDAQVNQEAEPKAEKKAEKGKVAKAWEAMCTQCKAVFRAGLDMTFVAERNGERVLAIPLLFAVIGMLVWGATLWLLIIGLFFGFRYRVDGASPITVNVNEVMDKAADMADDIKRDLA